MAHIQVNIQMIQITKNAIINQAHDINLIRSLRELKLCCDLLSLSVRIHLIQLISFNLKYSLFMNVMLAIPNTQTKELPFPATNAGGASAVIVAIKNDVCVIILRVPYQNCSKTAKILPKSAS